MKLSAILSVCAAAAVLVACGGGSDTPVPAPTTSVPASASTSISGWVSYMMALVASPTDVLEPVNVSTVTPPSSDTTEPATLN